MPSTWTDHLRRLGGRAAMAAIALLLLAIRLAWPESEFVAVLTRPAALAGEIQGVDTRGYYERLVHDPTGRESGSDDATPPPGSIVFAESGAVAVEPTYLRWRMKPNLDFRWNDTTFRTNSLGYRTPEIAVPRPAGAYRIVLLGSSNTMGHGVDDDEVYARALESWLHSATGRRVEVVNLAVSGDSPSQRLRRLQADVAALQPDWLVVAVTFLDIALEEVHLEAVLKEGIPIPFAYVRDALQDAGASPGDEPEALRRKVRSAFRPLLDGAYAGWAAEARQLGVPISLVLLPRADKVADNPNLRAFMADLAARRGLDLIDVSGAFEGLTVEQFQVAPWDLHPSPLGHRAIFVSLREALQRRGRAFGLDLP